jgi:hypothetical protein
MDTERKEGQVAQAEIMVSATEPATVQAAEAQQHLQEELQVLD